MQSGSCCSKGARLTCIAYKAVVFVNAMPTSKEMHRLRWSFRQLGEQHFHVERQHQWQQLGTTSKVDIEERITKVTFDDRITFYVCSMRSCVDSVSSQNVFFVAECCDQCVMLTVNNNSSVHWQSLTPWDRVPCWMIPHCPMPSRECPR